MHLKIHKIKYINIYNVLKTRHNTKYSSDKANKQKKMSHRQGTRNRDPFIYILRNPIETLNWKPMYVNIYTKDPKGNT